MPDLAGDEICLLKHSCKVVLEIASFFTGDDARARYAQKKLEKKHKDSTAFYANVWTDFGALDETLQGLPAAWSDVQGPGIRAVCALLQVIEDKFLNQEALVDLDDDDEDSDAEGTKVVYPLLRHPRSLANEHVLECEDPHHPALIL